MATTYKLMKLAEQLSADGTQATLTIGIWPNTANPLASPQPAPLATFQQTVLASETNAQWQTDVTTAANALLSQEDAQAALGPRLATLNGFVLSLTH